MKKIFCCWLVLLAFTKGYCQEESKHVETDRPNEAEVPYTVPRKMFQLETGVRIQNESGSKHTVSHPVLLVKYGLADWIELRAKSSYATEYKRYIPHTIVSSGLQPLELGIKAAVLKEKHWIPKTAFLLQTGLPRISSGAFKATHLAPTLRLLMENNITEKISFNYNVGAEWDGYETRPEWMYAFVPGIDISEHVQLFAEYYSFFQQAETPEHTLDGGIEYFIGKNIGLDICSGFGLNKAAPPFFFTVGGSVRF